MTYNIAPNLTISNTKRNEPSFILIPTFSIKPIATNEAPKALTININVPSFYFVNYNDMTFAHKIACTEKINIKLFDITPSTVYIGYKEQQTKKKGEWK